MSTRKKLKSKFLEISNVLSQYEQNSDVYFLPIIFDYYLDQVNFGTGENPFTFWKYSAFENITLNHVNESKPIPLKKFSDIALCLMSLPASEVMVERAFSHMKSISTKYNKSMLLDLFLALSSIKIAAKYQRKYPLGKPK